ncbi:heavy metal-responsive transcriptional regulator [Parathermosynechococcus lividus]
MHLAATPQLIGTVAKQSGLPIKTIRYYAELGLLKVSGRTEGGYRLFSSDVFVRLSFIKRAQHLGLTLADIKELLDIYDRGELPCDRVKEKLVQQITAVERQIQQMQDLKQELQGLLQGRSTITQPSEHTICPILQQGLLGA